MKSRLTIIAAICLAISFCILYLLSSTSTPTGYADADELTTTAYFGGVAHPPGYPLLTAVGHLYLSLSSPQNVAKATNYLSALIQSGGLLLFFFLSHLILKHVLRYSETNALYGAIASTSVLGTSYLFWLYGTTFEVVSLTGILTLITLIGACSWYLKPNKKWLLLTCFGFGLLMSHYQLGIVLAPGLLLLFFSRFNSYRTHQSQPYLYLVLGIIGAVATFFLVNSLLLIENHTTHPFSWDFNQTANGWTNHIFRKDYAGFDLETNRGFENSYVTTPTIDMYTFSSLLQFFELLWQHFGFTGYFLALLGFINIWKTQKWLAGTITTWFAISGPFLAMYMRITSLTFQPMLFLGISERQFLISELTFALFISIGITFLLRRIQSSSLPWRKSLQYVVILTILILSGLNNLSLLTEKTGRLISSKLALARLSTAKPDSVIICTNDVDCYTLFYYHLVEKKRPDIAVIPYMPVYTVNWLKQHPEYYPYADFNNPDYLAQLIAWNVPKRTVYLTSGINFYLEYIGLESGPFYLTSNDFLLEISKVPPKTIPSTPLSFAVPTITSLNKKDSYGQGIIETISTHRAYDGYLSLLYGQPQTARTYLTEAIAIDPRNGQAIELFDGLKRFSEELKITSAATPAAGYLKLAQDQEKAGNSGQAYQYFRFATYLAPTDIPTLTELASFYIRQGYTDQATIIEKHKLLFEK